MKNLFLKILRFIIDRMIKRGTKKKTEDRGITGNAGNFPGGADKPKKEREK